MTNSHEDELITVVQVFRHGERNPLIPFKIPIFEFKGELGALTDNGKRQVYDLGRYTRERYQNLLPPRYSSRFYHIISSSSERTLTSAQLFSAGLYPPTEEDVWNQDLRWDPIPVRFSGATLSINNPDVYFHPAYRDRFKDHRTMLLEKYRKEGLMEFIARNIGEDVDTVRKMVFVADACIFAHKSDIDLPQWVKTIYPNPLRDVLDSYFEGFFSVPETKRIYVGPFFHGLMKHLNGMAAQASSGPRLLVYSLHEVNILAILDTLNAHVSEWPSYAACLYFELWRGNDGSYVKLYYRNSNTVNPVVIGKDVSCKLEELEKLVTDYSVSEEDLMREAFELENLHK